MGSSATTIMYSNWANSHNVYGNNENPSKPIDGILAHNIHFCLGHIYKTRFRNGADDTTTSTPDLKMHHPSDVLVDLLGISDLL